MSYLELESGGSLLLESGEGLLLEWDIFLSLAEAMKGNDSVTELMAALTSIIEGVKLSDITGDTFLGLEAGIDNLLLENGDRLLLEWGTAELDMNASPQITEGIKGSDVITALMNAHPELTEGVIMSELLEAIRIAHMLSVALKGKSLTITLKDKNLSVKLEG